MKKYLAMFLILFVCPACFEYSSGTRTGQLVKFSQKGLLWKTWEGEMVLGGLKKKPIYNEGKYVGQTSVANTFEFSLDREGNTNKNQELLKILQNAEGSIIEVKYSEEFIIAPWRADTNYIIVSAKVIN